MAKRANDSIKRINDLWGLHNPSGTAPADIDRCLAFAVDGRYVEQDGVRYRLGVSFGGNPFTPADAAGFVGDADVVGHGSSPVKDSGRQGSARSTG